MNFRVVQPSALIDLNRLPELGYIREDGECLRIGAMTRERQLELDESIVKRAPLLHEAAPHIAHPQIRNRGTIGGSIVNADPAAELPVLMLALQARLKARSASGNAGSKQRIFLSVCSPPHWNRMKSLWKSKYRSCRSGRAGRFWRLRRAPAITR